MQYFTRGLLTTSIYLLVGLLPFLKNAPSAFAGINVGSPISLYYTYYGKKIPLTQKQGAIAVAFKTSKQAGTRGKIVPSYLRLQESLRGAGVRGKSLNVEVTPVGESYALVNIPQITRGGSTQVEERVKKQISRQSYVESTLPVVTRSEQNQTIILPNQVIISFENNLSENEKQAILNKYNLELIRPLRFNKNRYLVKSKSAKGLAVLDAANQVYQEKQVKSATPNFVLVGEKRFPIEKKIIKNSGKFEFNTSSGKKKPFQSNLLPLQWHLHSTPLKVCLNREQLLGNCLTNGSYRTKKAPLRTDIHAPEAWKKSNGGKGVVVAVLDSLIQWDHPDLINNIYSIGKVKDKLPGEVYGWDFAQNDADTRISKGEIAVYRSRFQDSFVLSDEQLLRKYHSGFISIPKESYKQIAEKVRNYFRNQVSSLFHGTMVSGSIAAKGKNLLGVAPNAKILPVRNGITRPISAATVEGLGYAAARGVDVINMSFSLPVQEVVDKIIEIQQAHPKLVLVAAAGNRNVNQVGYPSAIDGVISVGATNLFGNRTFYSSYGKGLSVVAPGGETSFKTSDGYPIGGFLTTGGTYVDGFWKGIKLPKTRWGNNLDKIGAYRWVQGTSFASPTVAGVIALMKAEDPQRSLSRNQLIAILQQTSSYRGLEVSQEEIDFHKQQIEKGNLPQSTTVRQYYFGSGLVNASRAVKRVRYCVRTNRCSYRF